ncbi:MAG: WecB/TagA/CpsF family glycosyltransferase [Planctomycetota bacterium]
MIPFGSYADVSQYVSETIAAGRKSFCVAINPEKVYRATHDADLRAMLDRADVTICDGIGVSIAAKLLYGKALRRVTGCDLFGRLIVAAEDEGWGVFLLGASPESNTLACAKLRERHPELRIVGSQHGYFNDHAAVIRQINASGADLLFVAMGSPRQEYWIATHRGAISAPFCMGVGGTLDVISGRAARAPKVFRKTGTEFLFRLVTNPRRWRRQAVLPLFMLAVLRQKISRGRRHQGPPPERVRSGPGAAQS